MFKTWLRSCSADLLRINPVETILTLRFYNIIMIYRTRKKAFGLALEGYLHILN